MTDSSPNMVENAAGKGDIAHNEQFLFFSHSVFTYLPISITLSDSELCIRHSNGIPNLFIYFENPYCWYSFKLS